jgi:hypothetical protein
MLTIRLLESDDIQPIAAALVVSLEKIILPQSWTIPWRGSVCLRLTSKLLFQN